MSGPSDLTEPRRPRVLLLAYACSPDRGSEPGVGWNRALQAARTCDTWVLCEEQTYGTVIRSYLERHGPIPGLTFVFVPRSSWETRLRRLPALNYLIYNLWQRRAFHLAQQLHERLRFDLVHQVTFCGFREPGYLWRLNAPFVWGPVGGTQNYPWRFLGQADLVGAVREALRSVVNFLQLRFSPRVRRAARSATALLAANSTIQRDLARAHGVQPILLADTGVTQVSAEPRPVRAESGPLRLLWSGDLNTWKALQLLLRALARLPAGVDYELRILGRGRLERSWQRLARRLGIEVRTKWLGWLPHPEALRQYQWADVFVFTSLRDTMGTVVLEALAAGLPVVCLDHQGVHDVVTPACGIKVPVTTPRAVVDGLRAAVAELADDPERRAVLSRGALERARDYLWSRLGERMAEVYRRVLAVPPSV